MPLADELRAAIDAATVLPAARQPSRATAVGALLFYPVVGGLLGAAAGWTASLAAGLGALPAALVATGVLAAASGAWSVRDLARAATPYGMPAMTAALAAALGAKVWAIASVPAPGRTVALAIAVMLGHWAVVVQCYGGRPAETGGPSGALVGRARLREFGWASTLAFGTTMAVLDAIGLLVLLAATLATVAIRVLAYRRDGGIRAVTLGASLELVEVAALAVLAALAR